MPLSDWSASALAQLEGGGLRPGFLFRMATDPVIRIWSGVGDIAIAADVIETEEGAVYNGFGALSGIPAFNQLINGLAERVEFGLSGVAITGEIAALASTDAAQVIRVPVRTGFLVFNAQWEIMSPTLWLGHHRGDAISVQRDDSQGTPVRSISLSVGSLFTGRSQPQISLWTSRDQKARSADDTFCDRVQGYSVGTTKLWPM